MRVCIGVILFVTGYKLRAAPLQVERAKMVGGEGTTTKRSPPTFTLGNIASDLNYPKHTFLDNVSRSTHKSPHADSAGGDSKEVAYGLCLSEHGDTVCNKQLSKKSSVGCNADHTKMVASFILWKFDHIISKIVFEKILETIDVKGHAIVKLSHKSNHEPHRMPKFVVEVVRRSEQRDTDKRTSLKIVRVLPMNTPKNQIDVRHSWH